MAAMLNARYMNRRMIPKSVKRFSDQIMRKHQ